MSSNPDKIIQSPHWLKFRNAFYTVISTTYKLLQFSSPHYFHDIITIQPSQSTPFSPSQLPSSSPSPVSHVLKSQIILSNMEHLNYGICFPILSVFHMLHTALLSFATAHYSESCCQPGFHSRLRTNLSFKSFLLSCSIPLLWALSWSFLNVYF